MRERKTFFTVCLLIALPMPFALAESIAVVGGRVVVGDGTVFDPGVVVIEGERIVSVGADLQIPDGARKIDASDAWVWPGIIDPYTTLGLVEVSADRMTDDRNESTEKITPQLRVSDAISSDSALVAVARNGGITSVLVSPGTSNPINGQAAVIDLYGRTVDEMIVKDPAAQVFSFGGSAKRNDAYPSTRMGIVAVIRQTLYDARHSLEQQREADQQNSDESLAGSSACGSLCMNALAGVLQGRVPVIAEATEAQEIRAALSVAEEFGLKMILLNPHNAWKLLDEIKASGVPVLLGGTFEVPEFGEAYDRYFRLAADLWETDIPFAFTSASAHGVRTLPTQAAKSVAYGLPEETAVRALTQFPAQILGIDQELGTLSPEKTANLAVWTGNPLQASSQVKVLIIGGNEVPLHSRQEELRDRFSELN
jgi:imidazolonepropionase-like amidohydrolase